MTYLSGALDSLLRKTFYFRKDITMLHDASEYTSNELRSICTDLETAENMLNVLAELSRTSGDMPTAILLQKARTIVLTECCDLFEVQYDRLTSQN